MSIERFVDVCGGYSNITRVLVPDDKLIFAIKDKALVVNSDMELVINQVLGEEQVVFTRPIEITQDQLLSVGKIISEQQKHQMVPFLSPVECSHRPAWHVSPPRGLLNDPNGFVYHDGQYHLFYQWYPYACVHKDKHWVHLTSPDLINWSWQSVALTPSDWFDSHGVFSGHALSHNDELMLFYTGNTRIGEQRERHTTQCLAVSKDGVNFEKQGPVILAPPPGVTEHIRDPKILKKGNEWIMLLGAQTTEMNGRIAVYRSSDLKEWQFDALYGDEFGHLGYMWECPDMFDLGAQTYVVLGPQGIESFSSHNTIEHHNGIAKAIWSDEEGLTLSDFEHLDYGFDFYAPQSLQTPDGRRVMCGWMGLPDEIDQPSTDSGWVHQLTTMREMSVKNGRLIQWPIEELSKLVESEHNVALSNSLFDAESKSYDLTLTLEWGMSLNLFEGAGHKVVLHANKASKCLVLDRSQTLNRANDTVRELALTSEKIALRILADTSSIEVFVNGGEAVMTSRVFTSNASTSLSVNGGVVEAILKRLTSATAAFVQ